MKKTVTPIMHIEPNILLLRGQKVMLDRDLAELYGVPTKVLKQAVNRNKARFPEDFAFIVDGKEAFTEQGVAMLSSVLNSEQAVQVNIAINKQVTNLWTTYHLSVERWMLKVECCGIGPHQDS